MMMEMMTEIVLGCFGTKMPLWLMKRFLDPKRERVCGKKKNQEFKRGESGRKVK
jgi:hypothetical protein